MKIKTNTKLNSGDYPLLQDIFMKELENEQYYKRDFEKTPFVLLIHKIGFLAA